MQNVQNLDFPPEEQQAVELLRDKQGTYELLSQNTKTVMDHPGNDTCTFLNGAAFINSVISSCGVYVNMLCEIGTVLNKKCNFYDPS